MNAYSDKQELTQYIKDIRLSGKGKGRFGLMIECNIPGVHGDLSAKTLGRTAMDELLDRIKGNWEFGRFPDGQDGPGIGKEESPGRKNESEDARSYRKSRNRSYARRMASIRAYDAGYRSDAYIYRQRIMLDVDSAVGTKPRYKFLKIWFKPKKENIEQSFNFSGLMLTSLKGYFRPGHTERTLGGYIQTNAGWMLQVAKNRQAAAAGFCGLEPKRIYRMFEIAWLPNTEYLLRKMIVWSTVREALDRTKIVADLVAAGFEQLNLFVA